MRTLIVLILMLLIAEVFTARAVDSGVRLFEEAERMLDGMPTLIALGEAAVDHNGAPVVIYTWIGGKTKVVAPMPPSGIYPTAVFRYRVRQNGEWQWYHERTFNDGKTERFKVSR